MKYAFLVAGFLVISARGEWVTTDISAGGNPRNRIDYWLGTTASNYTISIDRDAVVRVDGLSAVPSEAQLPEQSVADQWVVEQRIPSTFDAIAIRGPGDHWYEAVVADGEIVPVQISNSPLNHETRKAMLEAALASNTSARVELRRNAAAVRNNMHALVTTTTTASAQQQQIEELRRAVRDLAAVVRKMLKESGQ